MALVPIYFVPPAFASVLYLGLSYAFLNKMEYKNEC
jgi:hypothetical protein